MGRLAPAERRRQIVEAARRLFGTRGYHQTGIADIAAELDIGHGTFYRYFKNKRDIFQQVVNDLTGRVLALGLSEDPQGPETLEDYRKQVERLGGLLHQIFIADHTAARVVFVESLAVDDEMRQQIQRATRLLDHFTAEYLEHGRQKGYLRADLDVARTARMLNALVLEGIRNAVESEDPVEEARGWQAAYVALMFAGVAAGPEGR